MPITTYAELQTAIERYLDNNNPNLIAAIPDFIVLAESHFRRNLHVREMECRTSTPLVPEGTTEETSGVYSLPPDWGGHRVVERRNDSQSLVILYWRKLAALTDANPTNWLLDKHPDVYLWQSLTNAESFLKNDDRITLWAETAQQALADVIEHDQHDLYSGDTLRSRTPTNALWRQIGTRLQYLPPQDFFDLEGSALSTYHEAGFFTTTEDSIRIWPKPGISA